jgi:hypothetical protein
MAKAIHDRLTVVREDGIVVFIIGMRVNRWWKIHRWLPVALAMPRMLRELTSKPDSGLLFMVQYWESMDKLLAYASDRNGQHFPAWANFYRRIGKGGDVGIWHESYAVPQGAYEAIYVNMPPFGLGRFSKLEPAHGKRSRAKGRLGEAHALDAHGAAPAA